MMNVINIYNIPGGKFYRENINNRERLTDVHLRTNIILLGLPKAFDVTVNLN